MESSASKASRLQRVVVNYRVAFIAAGLIVVGAALFAWGLAYRADAVAHEVLVGLGLAVVIPAAVTLIFGLVTGRWLLDEVEARTGLVAEYGRAGVRSYRTFWEVDWETQFAGAQSLQVYVAWALSWARATCAAELKSFVQRPHTRLTIVLPDPDDDDVVQALANQFKRRTPEWIRDKIKETIDYYAHDLLPAKHDTATVEVWGMSFVPFFSAYVFDDKRAVVALMVHSSDRPSHLPTFLLTEGSFLEFVRGDIDWVKKNALCRRLLPPPDPPQGA